MKGFRKTVCTLLFGLVGLGAAGVTVSDVTARQRYPWNGKIDIDYTVTGTDTADTALAVSLTDHDTGRVYTLTDAGRHRVTWDTAVDGLDLVSSNVTATVSLVRRGSASMATERRLYCVIDLSGGPDAAWWPVSYLSSVPSGGAEDTYKTTKLILRRIEAGSFIMGGGSSDGSRHVTLTKPFYMGVFEVTQKQWELVMGSWPGSSPSSSYGCGDAYPAYYVSYDDIRGSSSGARWPASSSVDASSFLDRLRAKTGLDFDLPTEAQWEYACRAGTTTTYYWGDAMDGAYAWYRGNSGSTTHPVGTRTPNAWGLYDMSGNVWEWCRDWCGTLAYGADPVGSASGSYRVLRGGGSWSINSVICTSSDRGSDDPSIRYDFYGFRLVMALSD